MFSEQLIGFHFKLFGLTLNLWSRFGDIYSKEVSSEVLSPWMRLIDPNTLLDIMHPILKLSKPIPKFLAFISDNMPSNDTSVSKMVRNHVITTQLRIFFQFYREIAVHILKETQNIFNKHESPSYIYILNYLIFIQEKPKLIDLSDPSVAQGKFSKFETF